MDVTIVNLYGKDIVVLTSDPNQLRLTISAGKRYRFRSRYSSTIPVFFTAYDTPAVIQIDGKNSVSVSPSITPVSLIFYVPSGEFLVTNKTTE